MTTPIRKSRKKHDEGKESALNNLKALVPTGIFDINFFTKTDNHSKINVDPETLAHAFQLIDPTNNKPVRFDSEKENENKMDEYNRYKINFAELKKRIQIINPDFPISELSLFTGGKNEISFKGLFELLQDNEIIDGDPLDEAMKLILNKNQNLDLERLKSISVGLGYPPLENKDLDILKECLDADGDGNISRGDLDELMKFLVKK